MRSPSLANDVSLDFIGTAAKREDQRHSVVLLEPAAKEHVLGARVKHAGSTVNLHEQPRPLDIELRAKDLDRRGVRRRKGIAGNAPGLLPIEQLEDFELGVDASEVCLDPRQVDDHAAIAVGCLLGPFDRFSADLLERPDGAQRDPLVIELGGDQMPAVVFAAHDVANRHADVVVVHSMDVVLAERVYRRDLNAGRVGGHDDDRDALVRSRVRIGSTGEPHVVGMVGQAGPDLLAIDHIVVTIANGARREGREVGARARFGVPDRKVTPTLENLRRVLGLLLVGAEFEQGRPHRIERQDGNREARALHFVEEDELLDRTAALAAVFLWPANSKPAIGTQLLHRFVIERPPPSTSSSSARSSSVIRWSKYARNSSRSALCSGM